MADNIIEMEMKPKQLFRSISGFKYQLNEAIGDIVDNSVDAEATKIWIEVSKTEIIIADDGIGMDKVKLATAVTPWASAEESHRKNKLGRYGIGLKSASFSLGNRLDIHTKTKKDDFFHLKLDHKELIQKNDTKLPYSNKETELFKKFRLKSGTIIRIGEINARKVTQPAIDKLKSEIGLMFFKLIEKGEVVILVNDEKVEPLDPTLPDLKKGAPKNFYHSFGTKEIEFEKPNGETATLKIRGAHIGRGSFWSNNDRNKYRYFLRKKVTEDNELSSGILKLDDQGIYLMRNNRLITLGGWLGIVRSTSLLHHDVCLRVIIEYKSEDDDAIGVDHTKTKPDIVEALKDKLRDQVLQKWINESDERFRHEGSAISVEAQKRADKELKQKPLASSRWAQAANESKKIAQRISPEKFKEEEREEKQLSSASKEKEEWFQIVDTLPFKALWAGEKNKTDQVLVYLAERHPGYHSLYLEKNPNKLRKALNFMFFNMALFEVNAHDFIEGLKPTEKEIITKIFKEFRKFVSKQMSEIDE